MPPRLTVITFAIFLLFLFSILRPFAPTLSVHSSYYRDVFGRSRPLSDWLRDEDARYAIAVEDRQKLIRKYGPTEVTVDSYPSNGHLYTLWDFFIPAFQCPHRVERLGTLGDGGKWMCGVDRVAKQEKCVVYSFGINNDSSFESSLLRRAPACEIWGYDYSVKSWGPEINNNTELRKRTHFESWALGPSDRHGENDNPKFWSLDSIMELNGHTFIDVLKVDIEGGEFDALTAFIDAHADQGQLPIGQLQLEIHARDGRERFDYFNHWWMALEAAGLRPFWTEPNLVYVNIVRGALPELSEYSFINIRGDHALVSERFN